MLCDDLAQFRHAGGRPIVCEAFVQCVTSCLNDVAWCIEVGLSDFKMNDVAALCLERLRFGQHFECGLGTETCHAPGQSKFERLDHVM